MFESITMHHHSNSYLGCCFHPLRIWYLCLWCLRLSSDLLISQQKTFQQLGFRPIFEFPLKKIQLKFPLKIVLNELRASFISMGNNVEYDLKVETKEKDVILIDSIEGFLTIIKRDSCMLPCNLYKPSIESLWTVA